MTRIEMMIRTMTPIQTPSLDKLQLQRQNEDTVSSHIYAHFWTAHNPCFGSQVIFKSVVTQCESCLRITTTATFILIWLKMLCALYSTRSFYCILACIRAERLHWGQDESGDVHYWEPCFALSDHRSRNGIWSRQRDARHPDLSLYVQGYSIPSLSDYYRLQHSEG